MLSIDSSKTFPTGKEDEKGSLMATFQSNAALVRKYAASIITGNITYTIQICGQERADVKMEFRFMQLQK
jgi:hypothetical protein